MSRTTIARRRGCSAQFIDVHHRKIRRARRRRRGPVTVTIETRGEVHDLKEIYDELNRRYFDGAHRRADHLEPAAGAGRAPAASQLDQDGLVRVEDRLIRIHASLDRPFVPRLFVEWIVYHEMLHQKHDIPVVGGRRRFHTEEFLLEEAAFEHYHRARPWERDNLDRLLNY